MRHANCKQRSGPFSWRTLAIILGGGFVAQLVVFGMTVDVLSARLSEIESIAAMQGGWVWFDLSE